MTNIPSRFAAIDIGTNTIKIKISDISGKNRFEQVLYRDFSSGLGKNISPENIISDIGIKKCITTLKEIKKILVNKNVDSFKCISTHILRVAKNKKEILRSIKSETGLDVEVISGKREAELTLKGILIDFSPKKNFACINIGGGSTELSFRINGNEQFFFFKFGALNLYDNNLKNKDFLFWSRFFLRIPIEQFWLNTP